MANLIVRGNPVGTCTPSELIDTNPCFQCLSEKELLAVLVFVFVTANQSNIAQALVDSACFTCMSKKQMLQAVVSILANTYLSGQTIDEIKQEMKCLECASDNQLRAALLQQFCAYWQSLPT